MAAPSPARLVPPVQTVLRAALRAAREAVALSAPVSDVVVAGAGPAGAAAALCLARTGASVALVDPFDDGGGLRVGETLAPMVRDSLSLLGLWERFTAAGHRPAYAIRSAWGGAEPVDRDLIFDPRGHGWHVDRKAFDRMLVDAAAEAGALLVRGSVGEATRRNGGWTIETGEIALHARWVIDATGRAARVARRHGARPLVLDRLIGVVASVGPEQTTSSAEGATLVEAVPDGWWYSARTPDDRLLIAFMTDADLWPRGSRPLDRLVSRLAAAPLTRARLLRPPETDAPIRVVAATSARLSPPCGTGWMAAGDAAMAVDPLCGNGVGLALRSGIRVAGAILRGEDAGDANCAYAAEIARAFSEYEATWRWFYGCERRFPSSEFWERRRHARPPVHVSRPRPSPSRSARPSPA
jgi:flavin-dependent dehydrogenase